MPIHIIPDESENSFEGAYLPGEIARGQIIIDARRRFKARRLSATYVGMEKTYVTRSSGKHQHTYTEHFYYFYIEDVLMEPKPGKDSIIINGRNTFDYEFEIPENVPQSFKFSRGRGGIQYLIDVKIDKPMASDIHKILELVVIPSSLEKIEQEPLNDLLIADGYIPQCTLTCNEEVFYEGDTVEIELNVHLRYKPKIKDLRVSIESILTKTARGHTDTFKNMLKGWKINKKELRMGENIFTFSYEIPMEIPYAILGMLIKRNYFVHLKVNRSFHPDNHIWLPIVISPSFME